MGTQQSANLVTVHTKDIPSGASTLVASLGWGGAYTLNIADGSVLEVLSVNLLANPRYAEVRACQGPCPPGPPTPPAPTNSPTTHAPTDSPTTTAPTHSPTTDSPTTAPTSAPTGCAALQLDDRCNSDNDCCSGNCWHRSSRRRTWVCRPANCQPSGRVSGSCVASECCSGQCRNSRSCA